MIAKNNHSLLSEKEKNNHLLSLSLCFPSLFAIGELAIDVAWSLGSDVFIIACTQHPARHHGIAMHAIRAGRPSLLAVASLSGGAGVHPWQDPAPRPWYARKWAMSHVLACLVAAPSILHSYRPPMVSIISGGFFIDLF